MRHFSMTKQGFTDFRSHRMSDPSELSKAEPHPVSSHRTPHEIAEDEAGPIGGRHRARKDIRAEDGPVRKLNKPPEKPAEPSQGVKPRR
jgi:hypothetical protein